MIPGLSLSFHNKQASSSVMVEPSYKLLKIFKKISYFHMNSILNSFFNSREVEIRFVSRNINQTTMLWKTIEPNLKLNHNLIFIKLFLNSH